MPERIDQFSIAYSKFTEEVVNKVRRETFGDDIGQNSWTLKQEYEGFLQDLQVTLGKRLLDVACGAGGPALFSARKTGCSVVGIDMNADGIATAKTRARELGLANRAIIPSDRCRYETALRERNLRRHHLRRRCNPLLQPPGTFQRMEEGSPRARQGAFHRPGRDHRTGYG